MNTPPKVNKCCREKYANDILKSESDIAKCLKYLFCNEFVCKINQVDSVEKRAELIKKVVCAYACKENAMANLINALNNLIESNRNCCFTNNHKIKVNKDFCFSDTIIILIIVAIIAQQFLCCGCIC